MKVFALTWLLIIVAILYIAFFGYFGNDGTILIGCGNAVQTRGGTICLDSAYKR